MARTVYAGLALLLLCLQLGAAEGRPRGGSAPLPRNAPDGTVVQLDDAAIYFDLGQGRGLQLGGRVEVLRSITARHPVTEASLADWFPLATVTVDGVGPVLSRAPRVPGVKVGDAHRPNELHPVAIAAPSRGRRSCRRGIDGVSLRLAQA